MDLQRFVLAKREVLVETRPSHQDEDLKPLKKENRTAKRSTIIDRRFCAKKRAQSLRKRQQAPLRRRPKKKAVHDGQLRLLAPS